MQPRIRGRRRPVPPTSPKAQREQQSVGAWDEHIATHTPHRINQRTETSLRPRPLATRRSHPRRHSHPTAKETQHDPQGSRSRRTVVPDRRRGHERESGPAGPSGAAGGTIVRAQTKTGTLAARNRLPKLVALTRSSRGVSPTHGEVPAGGPVVKPTRASNFGPVTSHASGLSCQPMSCRFRSFANEESVQRADDNSGRRIQTLWWPAPTGCGCTNSGAQPGAWSVSLNRGLPASMWTR
jgi:hypothetical protein